MSDFKYTKLDEAHKTPAPMPRAPPGYDEESQLIGKATQPSDTHFLASALSTFFCCFPAGIVSMFYSSKTFCANRVGNYTAAGRYSLNAKKYSKLAVIFGLMFIALCGSLQVVRAARWIQKAELSFVEGLVAGIDDGQVEGSRYAFVQLQEGVNRPVMLPEQLPLGVNVFDLRQDNPFWVEVRQALHHKRGHEAAKPFGYQFGWAHGFKVGFCAVEDTDCTGVEFNDSPCAFQQVFGFFGRHGNYHHHGNRADKEKMVDHFDDNVVVVEVVQA